MIFCGICNNYNFLIFVLSFTTSLFFASFGFFPNFFSGGDWGVGGSGLPVHVVLELPNTGVGLSQRAILAAPNDTGGLATYALVFFLPSFFC